MQTIMKRDLIRKYNVPAPRYTSYPTVPYWEPETFSLEGWKQGIQRSFAETRQEGISLYIHLPFCESMCTFCGCNKRITRNHGVETTYIDALLHEWALYRASLGPGIRIQELHLGGGTPTFFQPDALRRLLEGILGSAPPTPQAELGFEGHPNNTTSAHLQTLYELGFRRVSYGVQDFDPRVQEVINRIQPYEAVEQVMDASRAIGYSSVNVDLVYGLPLQRLQSIEHTLDRVQQLQPDRISFYSYAHVPWVKGVGQRKFTEADLPRDEEKRQLYERGKVRLLDMGYEEIGMDHFALPSDELYHAWKEGRLHRNFMGYTPVHTQLQLGLGVSAIGDAWYGFAQNEKKLETYYERLSQEELPLFRGHLLTEEDLLLRRHVLNLMCHMHTSWAQPEWQGPGVAQAVARLEEVARDGLIEWEADGLRIPERGRPFLRNICMAFDARLWRKKPDGQLFSMAI